MGDDKLEVILKKRRQIYLKQLGDKIKEAGLDLLEYDLEGAKTKDKLINFFHGLKDSGSTLGFLQLSSLGEEYQNNLEKISTKDKFILTVVDGLAKAYQQYRNLKDESVVKEEVESASLNPKAIMSAEYVNITYAGNILIVDDDLALLNLLEKFFRQKGYNIFIASKSKEVVGILEKEDIDLIILDIMMPKQNGFEVFEEIRVLNYQQPIIFLSDKDNLQDKIKGLELGAADYMIKPFDVEELIARVENNLKQANSAKNQIIKDELTDAYTKSHFRDRANEERARAIREAKTFALAFFDIDHFKRINDNYGHLVGDDILRDFAHFIRDNLREVDQLYRFGGDEFLILFSNTDSDEAYQVLERVRAKLKEKEFSYDEIEDKIKISFSAGIAHFEDNEQSIEGLLEKADQVLYDVKKTGRGAIKKADSLKESNEQKEILIVDDESIILQLIKTRFEGSEYQINYAKEGQEGLELFEEIKPNLLIVDLMMPKVNGFELLRKIKERGYNNEVKIIILSSRKNEQDISRAFKLGIDDYLTKPFSLVELENRIKKLI